MSRMPCKVCGGTRWTYKESRFRTGLEKYKGKNKYIPCPNCQKQTEQTLKGEQ